jgi:DNA gyrase subunit A
VRCARPGRNTQGVRIIRLEEGEQVVGVEPVAEPDDEAGGDSLRPTAVADEATPAEGDAPAESAPDADAPAADNPTEPA